MSAEIIGLFISVVSLALGVISAWPQIRSLLVNFVKFSSHKARSWSLRDRETTKIYLDQPSTFLAYLGKSAISLALLLVSLIFIKPSTILLLYDVSHSAAEYISSIPPCFIGLLLASVSNRCSDVLDLARNRNKGHTAA